MLRDNSKKTMIIKKVEKNIKEYNLIESDDKVLVAVSGGSDSMCLLYSLIELSNKLNFKIEVAHVHHMLRKESDAEAEYVRKFCDKFDIKCHVGKFDINKISKETKEGTEATARKVRYKFFKEISEKNNIDKVAIAHNINDNVETILMHFIRGTSLNGLTGIKYKNREIIRPLLNIKKEDINLFCEECKIDFAIDKTNNEMIYTRNKLRLDLIKKIEEYNINFVAGVERMASTLTEEEDYLDETTEKLLKKVIISETDNDIIIDRKVLGENHSALVKRVIIKLIQKITNRVDNIESSHIIDIKKIIINGVTGKKFIIDKKYIFENIDKHKAIIKKY